MAFSRQAGRRSLAWSLARCLGLHRTPDGWGGGCPTGLRWRAGLPARRVPRRLPLEATSPGRASRRFLAMFFMFFTHCAKSVCTIAPSWHPLVHNSSGPTLAPTTMSRKWVPRRMRAATDSEPSIEDEIMRFVNMATDTNAERRFLPIQVQILMALIHQG